MPESVNNNTVRILTQGSGGSGDIYQGYASGLYRQAFLTLGDTALAVRVVSDVIAERARWPRRRCDARRVTVAGRVRPPGPLSLSPCPARERCMGRLCGGRAGRPVRRCIRR
jgi:hypothetical protein